MKRLRRVLGLLITLGLFTSAYWVGYQAGLKDRGPDHRALMIVRRGPGNSMGTSAIWFDFRKPDDLARFRRAEQQLKVSGAEYYVAKGLVESTLSPEPDPRFVNAHR